MTQIEVSTEDCATRDERCARWMFGLVRAVMPNTHEPNWKDWARDIRLIRERDKKTYEEIFTLFTWANNDEFWWANIRSPGKLRKQWDALEAQRLRKQRGRTKQPDTRMPTRAHADGILSILQSGA